MIQRTRSYHRILLIPAMYVQFGAVFEGEAAVVMKEVIGKAGLAWDVWHKPETQVGPVTKVYMLPATQRPEKNFIAFEVRVLQEVCEKLGIAPTRYEIDFKRGDYKAACAREDDREYGVAVKWGFGRKHPLKQYKVCPETSGRMTDHAPGTVIVHEGQESFIWKGFTPLYIWTRYSVGQDQEPKFAEAFWRVTTNWTGDAVEVAAEHVFADKVPAHLVPDCRLPDSAQTKGDVPID